MRKELQNEIYYYENDVRGYDNRIELSVFLLIAKMLLYIAIQIGKLKEK